MALVLGMAINDGVFFFVGQVKTRAYVKHIMSPTLFTLVVEGVSMDRQYDISDQFRTQIMPQVYAQAGNTGSNSMVKLALEAPREIRIVRENLYKRTHG